MTMELNFKTTDFICLKCIYDWAYTPANFRIIRLDILYFNIFNSRTWIQIIIPRITSIGVILQSNFKHIAHRYVW